jgi:hypothetical protein
MNAKGRISVKFSPGDDYLDPSPEFLKKLCMDVNKFFSCYQKVSNPTVDGNYVNFDWEFSDMNNEELYMTGMIAGYMMANGFQIR